MDLDINVRSALMQRIFNTSMVPTPRTTETHVSTSANNTTLTQPIELDKSDGQLLLEEINESIARLERIAPSGFNLADLVFLPCEEPPSVLPHLEDKLPPEIETFLAGLDPVGASSQRFKFIVRSLRSLQGDLESLLSDINELHSELAPRCEDVLGRVKLELDRLLIAGREAHKMHLSRERAHIGVGARRIDLPITPISPATRLSPITTAAIIVIATIHCFMNVSRENCHFILRALRAMLKLVIIGQHHPQQAHLLNSVERIPVTLETSLHYLGIQPNLNYYVVCPRCATLYPEGEEVPERCTAVDVNHHACGAAVLKLRRRGGSVWMRPRKRYSHQTLEEWLSFFLNRPGIEDLIEGVRPKLQADCTDFWGASYFNSFPGPGQKNFFDAKPEDLRLAFLIYHDFFNPFTNGMAAKQRSIGTVTMVCLNLPYPIRYNRENLYTTAIIPGPSEPSREQINNYIRPIAKNMKEHYYPGVWIARTNKYPNGRHVRSAAMVESMDLLASRSWGGLGSPTHTILCSFCSITKDNIDTFDHVYPARNMLAHSQHVQLWLSAPDILTRNTIWKRHAARYSEWLCFPWWSPFLAPIAPMHWMKNVLEKQLRENMNWSWTIPTGIPLAPKSSKLVTTLELEWGEAALKYYDATELERTKLTEPLLRYLCVKRRIFNAGRNSKYMLKALNNWRASEGIINDQGEITALANQESHALVSLARAQFYLSRAKDANYLVRKTRVGDLMYLCKEFNLSLDGTHIALATTLVNYNKQHPLPNTTVDGLQLTSTVAVLGHEVMAEIQEDMRNTIIPSWVKAPPINFGTISHGKIEMFIGMLQDIPTNWKFGELEPTIHREIITASNLQALLTQSEVMDAIAQVGETVQEYLDHHYPTHTGIYSNGWVVSHPEAPTAIRPTQCE
ncbi:hypothetical protein RSAG8_13144, partial [Rhizoctonia solani AG-8 WAC10335]